MHIGIDIREFKKGRSTGIGRYLRNFIDYVSHYDRENRYTLFANQRTEYRCQLPKNIRIKVIKEWLAPFWDQVQLPLSLKRERIDLFFSPYYKKPFFTPARSIITIHDLNPLFLLANSIKLRLKYRLYFATVLKLSSRRADKIIAVSQYVKEEIIKLAGVPRNKVAVIYNGVGKEFHPIVSSMLSSQIKKRLNILGEFILYVGNLMPHKNVRRLIEAYAGLPDSLKTKYQLVIGGTKGEFFPPLLKRTEELKLKGRVIFTDFISSRDIASIYQAATLFVFPSLCEGFGLPPLEAMACGTPVIVSNITSLPEVVEDAGILVNPYEVDEIKETIIRVLTDSKLRNDLIQEGLKRAEQFTLEKTAKRILEVFGEV